MIRPTTLLTNNRLNNWLGIDIILASETFQYTGSFKFRGAWHMVSNVPHKHFVTSSSGNFGQALAFACKALGKHCTVVMPHNSAVVKIEAVRDFGGAVELIDLRKKSREVRIAEIAKEHPEAYIASGF